MLLRTPSMLLLSPSIFVFCFSSKYFAVYRRPAITCMAIRRLHCARQPKRQPHTRSHDLASKKTEMTLVGSRRGTRKSDLAQPNLSLHWPTVSRHAKFLRPMNTRAPSVSNYHTGKLHVCNVNFSRTAHPQGAGWGSTDCGTVAEGSRVRLGAQEASGRASTARPRGGGQSCLATKSCGSLGVY